MLGVLLAYIQRGKPAGGDGQVVDVAIYESVFNMLEAVVPEYDGAGLVRQPSGSTLTGIVPTNTYACRDGAEVLARLAAASVPAGPIYTVADMLRDPHFHARGLFQQVDVDGQPLRIPALTPHLTATPGATTWPGPEVGAHNDEILGGLLGLSDGELAALREEGVV